MLHRLVVGGLALVTAGAGAASGAARPAEQAGSSAAPAAYRALVARYCLSCHNDRTRTANPVA